MSSPPDHDSATFVRLDGSADIVALPAIPEVPICDLNSKDPLPAELVRPSNSETSSVQPKDETLESGTPASGPLGGAIWRSGDVLMCACPDCQAPMSIRVWLMVADC